MDELINEIIKGLGADKPIKSILLKSQIVASELGNTVFSKWISNEQNGYPDAKNLPEYRILGATVKADIFVPYMGYVNNQTIPVGIFDHKVINECMGQVRIVHSLSEIENLCSQKGNGAMFSHQLPAMAYLEVNRYISGEAQRVWQEFPVTSLAHIVDVFKSRLLDFFLSLNKEIKSGIDFSQISSQDNQQIISQIMNNYNINAAVANTGNGSVSTGDITACNFNINPSNQIRSQMNEVVVKLETLLSNNDSDMNEALTTLKEEAAKPSWNKKILKMALNAINGIACGVVANKITPLVAQGLALL